ncbi:MAG TPA: hypothetical protein VF707_17705 [Ardenticatenaceae bacterium]|jgi:hypothetical protein
MDRDTASHFVICIKNVGYEDDLKPRTVYQLLPDEAAEASQFVRVVDETGEEYLYPSAYFVPIEVPGEAEQVLFLAS